MIDEENKEGPPFLVEMEQRENAIISKTKSLNDNKGQENYIQMVLDKNREKQRRLEEIDDFQASYNEELLHKWNTMNKREFNDKLKEASHH